MLSPDESGGKRTARESFLHSADRCEIDLAGSHRWRNAESIKAGIGQHVEHLAGNDISLIALQRGREEGFGCEPLRNRDRVRAAEPTRSPCSGATVEGHARRLGHGSVECYRVDVTTCADIGAFAPCHS